MKTVLFAAELGDGLGHVAPLHAIAERLADAGIRPVFCVRDPVRGRAILGDRRYAMLASPPVPRSSSPKSHSSSYAELLAMFGFARGDRLASAIAAWDDVFDLVGPDLLVADHSPIACLAARARIPTVVIGNGYTLPPADMPAFPALKAGTSPPTAQRSILNTVNDLLRQRSGPPLQALPQLLSGDRRLLFTLPHLDPYGPLRKESYLGSYHTGLAPTPPPAEPRVFVYGGASSVYLEAIVQALAELGLPISAYLGGAESATSVFLRNRGATVYSEPPPLSEVLAEASMVVSHGGSGLTLAALVTGRPQVILPIHDESQITAGRVEHLGVGLAVLKFSREEIRDALSKVAEIRHFRERAEEVARRIGELQLPRDPVGEAGTACLALLDSR